MLNLTTEDRELLKARGVTEEQLEQQVDRFRTGFPYLRIAAPARCGAGITVLSAEEEAEAVDRWKQYLAAGGSVCKFVPASGAASRMFKALFAFVDCEKEHPEEGSDVQKLIAGIHDVAFYKELNDLLLARYSKDVDALLAEGREKDVIAAIIRPERLNYGNLPKGLLTFHHAGDGTRTPVEEQLMEGAQSARQADGTVNMHLTVSGSHREAFAAKIAEVTPAIEKKMNVKINVSMSEQKASTDTVAVNEDNTLFRENGEMVFRPGGHGALIENLNDVDADVVFVKNIDNVVPDSFKCSTVIFKKVIAGVLVSLQERIFKYLELIDSGKYSHDQVEEMIRFLQEDLCVKNPETKLLEDAELILYIKSKLNRPLRVCGMVKNVGEPGGGPFLAVNSDGTVSLQILESSQIDLKDPEKKAMFEKGTHFNPVDLVCALKNYKGEKFNLPDYVDKNTGFISYKSKDGRELKALELPGLWNGAMSDWNTVFVEVPVETFNPVKTVNDLLRQEHQ